MVHLEFAFHCIKKAITPVYAMQISTKDSQHEAESRRDWISIAVASFGVLISFVIGTCNYHVASSAKEKAETFGSIGAEVHWVSLRDAFYHVDSKIKEWEKSQNFSGDGVAVESFDEMSAHLERLNIPKETRQLYIDRFEKFETLKRVAQYYAPVMGSLSRINFSMPDAPKLPRRGLFGSGTIRGGSIK